MAASPLAPAWLNYPNDANELNPALWAQGVSRLESGELALDGIGVRELAARYGTPVFVMSETDFRSRARAFRDAFDEAFAAEGGADVYYAGKAFLSLAVASWMNDEGLRIDTCSGGELLVALRAGVDPAHIGLHGNNKSDSELNRALEVNLGRIVVDSIDELEHLAALAGARGTVANVLLRLKPGVHAHTHEYIATAHEDQKFGLSMLAEDQDVSEAMRAVDIALGSDAINLLGVHAHIGSQIFDPEGFEMAAVRLIDFLADIAHRHRVQLPELDLGGGYGIAYTPEDTPRKVAEIAQAIAAVVRQRCAEAQLEVPRISIEPGRAIAGPSTFTLYTAGVRKDVEVDVAGGTATRRYLSVDGGMSDNPRPVLYDADYSAVLASRASVAEPILTRVAGKHCESGDIVVRSAYLPADAGRGDLIAVPGTGAYCWALSSNYNYLGRPPVVALKDGASRLIVRGENEDDLLRRDVGANEMGSE